MVEYFKLHTKKIAALLLLPSLVGEALLSLKEKGQEDKDSYVATRSPG